MSLCNSLRSSLVSSLVWIVFFAVSTPMQAQGFEIVPIARPGDPTPEGDVFRDVSTVSINSGGQIAFPARVARIGSGVFLFAEGKIHTIVQEGDPAPRGGNFGLPGNVSINDHGHVAFSSRLTSTPESGIYLSDSTSILNIVRTGDAAPDGGIFDRLQAPSLNNRGQLAFMSRLAGEPDYGVFFYSGSKMIRVAAPGDPAPGGGTFVRAFWPSLNDSGQIVFEGRVSLPGRGGIFLYEDGELRQIVRGGDPAPDGGTFSGFYRPLINVTGQVAFVATLVPRPETLGLFLFEGGGIRRVLPFLDPETGDEIRSLGPRAGYPHPFYFNGAGQIAFEGSGRFKGEERAGQGLFFFDGERFKTVAFRGDPMPDPQDYEFTDFIRISLSDSGLVAFVADYPFFYGAGLFLAIPNSR